MKNVLIIGATSGIANAFSHEAAKQGINLILAGRHIDKLKILKNDLTIRYKINSQVIFFDALDYRSHPDFFAQCIETFPLLDGVLLAYGHMEDQQEVEKNLDLAHQVIEVNYVSAVSILSLVANFFENKQSGVIAAISSVAGDRGRQSNYLYGSSKGALNLFLQGLRNRLSKANVHVLTIKPGFVDTKMTYGLNGMFLVASPELVGKKILMAVQSKKDLVYIPWFWKYIMLIIKMIPEKIFKKLAL
jgi:decaprenylphospho-beta-D-erythro-pentofuranosid-2-ulose 2-reductase